MIDTVAKAICEAAGKSIHADPEVQSPSCSCCEHGVCMFWETFRGEARAAILAAYKWHKQERRWPSFCAKEIS